MSDSKTNSKTEFIRFVMATIDNESSDEQKAREYLSSQGLNVEAIASEGLKKIKRIQMVINAEKTKSEMASLEEARKQVENMVDQLISKPNFRFSELVKEEEVLVAFSKVESLNQMEIREILIKHYSLKLIKEGKGGNERL